MDKAIARIAATAFGGTPRVDRFYDERETTDVRHHLLMESFDWPTLSSYIKRRVHECEGATWREVAEKLARLGYWEFEDYRP